MNAEERNEDQDDDGLGDRDERSRDGLADDDRKPRDGCDQHLLHEPELPVPYDRDGREDRREQDGHADHAREYELEVGKAGQRLDERAHAVPDHEKPEHGPRERAKETAFFPEELFKLPQTDDVDRPPLDHRCALRWLRTNSRVTSLS